MSCVSGERRRPGYFGCAPVAPAILALKIAEVAWMNAKSGHWPVLLLDEVLAELDAERRYDLLSRLGQSEQALLSTTDLDLFDPEYVKNAIIWRVAGGRVEKAGL
jgi:DNA replication and repair protein RecF